MNHLTTAYATFAFDFKLMRPGCVLLQAAMGCFKEDGSNPALDFPNESWLLAPTPDLKAYSIATEEMYRNIVDNYDALVAHHEAKTKK